MQDFKTELNFSVTVKHFRHLFVSKQILFWQKSNESARRCSAIAE